MKNKTNKKKPGGRRKRLSSVRKNKIRHARKIEREELERADLILADEAGPRLTLEQVRKMYKMRTFSSMYGSQIEIGISMHEYLEHTLGGNPE